MNFLLLYGRILLALVFATAGGAKAFDQSGSRKAVNDFGLPGPLVRPVAFALPIAELVTAILLLWAGAAFWGATAAFALLLAFALVIAINLVNGRSPECHCFGQLHSRPISWALLRRDATLAALAAVIMWKGPGMSIVAAVRRFTGLATAQPLPVAAALLAVLGFIVQTFLLLALFRQHGGLMLRLDKLEQSAGGPGSLAPPPPAAAGLPAGARAPSFELSSENGGASLETLLISGRPVVLVFTDPDCGPCLELLPDIARWERQSVDMVTFVVISRASPSAGEGPGANYVFRNMAWERNREISESYRVGGTPAAVVVRPDARIGSWLATGRPGIQALIMFLLYLRMFVGSEELVS